MGRFRPGDVCVIVDGPGFVSLLLRKFIGCECTVIAVGLTDSRDPRCTIRVEIPGFKSAYGNTARLKPGELRLRRPPSWDQWIADTRDVERECKEGQPA